MKLFRLLHLTQWKNNIIVNITNSRAKHSDPHLLAQRPWISHLTSMGLSFHIYTWGVIIVTISSGHCED